MSEALIWNFEEFFLKLGRVDVKLTPRSFEQLLPTIISNSSQAVLPTHVPFVPEKIKGQLNILRQLNKLYRQLFSQLT